MRKASLLFALAFVSLAGCARPKPAPAPAEAPARPSYITRGEAIEAKNHAFIANLADAHARLRKTIQERAPSLMPLLEPAPPAPVKYGYQLLPKLLFADAAQRDPGKAPKPEIIERSFTWAKAEQAVDSLIARFDQFNTALKAAEAQPTEPKLRELISTYQGIDSQRGVEERVIQYNKTWQDMIAKELPRWNSLQEHYEYLLKRGAGAPPERRPLADRPFMRVETEKDGTRTIVVPLATDIKKAKFIADFKRLIEGFWRWDDGMAKYAVRLEISRIPVAKLYPEGGAPKEGSPFDLNKHLARFPKNNALLTTGANQLYFDSRPDNMPFIVLSAGDAAEFPLAHEFGHVLGFHDEYVRGYRDAGADGYEILELMLDGSEIMTNSNGGFPRRWHFESVINKLTGAKK